MKLHFYPRHLELIRERMVYRLPIYDSGFDQTAKSLEPRAIIGMQLNTHYLT